MTSERDATVRNIIKSVKVGTLTVEEVAERMRISPSTARKLAAKSDVDFPKSFKVGRHRRWSEDMVEKFIAGDSEARA